MELKIKINLDNASFADYAREPEIEFVLKQITTSLYLGLENDLLRDSNGNKVGEWRIEE